MAGRFDPAGLLAPRVEPDLRPLRNSHEADQIEAELKALFIELFEAHIRPGERFVNLLGAPHLGGFDLIEAAAKPDGLSMIRGDDDGRMRYLFKAWRARNHKRGLTMLQTYLQMLWPNAWSAVQLWCRSAEDYPAIMADSERPGHFLTSRVRVRIADEAVKEDIARVNAALRTVVPARMVLSIAVEGGFEVEEPQLACAAAHAVVQGFEFVCE